MTNTAQDLLTGYTAYGGRETSDELRDSAPRSPWVKALCALLLSLVIAFLVGLLFQVVIFFGMREDFVRLGTERVFLVMLALAAGYFFFARMFTVTSMIRNGMNWWQARSWRENSHLRAVIGDKTPRRERLALLLAAEQADSEVRLDYAIAQSRMTLAAHAKRLNMSEAELNELIRNQIAAQPDFVDTSCPLKS